MQSLEERNTVMKKLCLIMLLGTVASAWAGDPSAPTATQIVKPPSAGNTGRADAAPDKDQKSTTQIESHARETPLRVEKPAPNETVHGRIEVDGIFVQLDKMDNPLQLINPAAPERYGSAEENVLRNPASGKVSGLKFLELRF
jgi:hypothetical protein